MEDFWRDMPMFDQRVLEIQYSKNRFYHDANHTTRVYSYSRELFNTDTGVECSGEFDRCYQQAAAWHDVVYDMNRNDNEEQSAIMFEKSEMAKRMDPFRVQKIADAIRASANHWAPENEELRDDTLIFLDADLAELAAPWPVFERNSENIFREYRAMVKDAKIDIFFDRRKQFYEMLLAKPNIYWKSPHLENPARANLELGIKLLESVKG